LIQSWVMKEFRNLKKAQEIGINAPRPLAIEDNVIVMQYIGEDKPALPLLKHEMEDPEDMFKEVIKQVKRMYKAGLVHADLSEYNILVLKEKPYLIDFGQAVLLTHPKALEFLERDIWNVCTFFKKKGVDCDPVSTLNKIRNG